LEDSNRMKRIKYAILTLSLLAFGLALFNPLVVSVGAAMVQCPSGVMAIDAAHCGSPNPQPDPGTTTSGPLSEACKTSTSVLCTEVQKTGQLPSFAKIITNTLMYVLGAVSVIVIIIAGIMYTTSGGDAALIAKAKNTLLYAVVGLLVAIMAYAIVNFVITQFK